MKSYTHLIGLFIEKTRNDSLVSAIKSTYKYLLPVRTRFRIYSCKVRILGHCAIGDPLRIYNVDPQKIQYIYTGESVDFVAKGDWDINGKIHMDDWFRMSMFIKHFKYGVPWKKIEEYQMLENIIQEQGYVSTLDIPKNEHSVEKLHDYHMYIDELYEKIKNEGYKSQKELNTKDDYAQRDRHPSMNEIQVCISRDGLIMPSTGYHRFTIAKILGIESVPVRTQSRHLEWQRIRNEFHLANSKSKLENNKMGYIGHPELEDVMPSHK